MRLTRATSTTLPAADDRAAWRTKAERLIPAASAAAAIWSASERLKRADTITESGSGPLASTGSPQRPPTPRAAAAMQTPQSQARGVKSESHRYSLVVTPTARRSTYRVIYRIDEEQPTVSVAGVVHRSDAYRLRR